MDIYSNINKLYDKQGFYELYGIDLLIALAIIFIFLTWTSYYFILNHLPPIKNNWGKHRCNPFYMPFLISTEKSARYIYNGLQTNRFEIFYPKIFGYILKVLRVLPYFLLLPILKSMLKKYNMRK